VYIIAHCSSLNRRTFFSLYLRCCPVLDLTASLASLRNLLCPIPKTTRLTSSTTKFLSPNDLQRVLAQPPVSSQPEPFLHVKPPKSTGRENDGLVTISRSKLNTLTNIALDSYHIPNTPWDNEYLWSKDPGNPDRVRGRQSETTALAEITNVRPRVKSNQHGSSVSGLSDTSSINESKRLHRTVKGRVSKARGLRKEHKHAATSLKEYIKRGEAFCNRKRIEMKRKSHAHRRRVELMR
jgi:hypothetical protein